MDGTRSELFSIQWHCRCELEKTKCQDKHDVFLKDKTLLVGKKCQNAQQGTNMFQNLLSEKLLNHNNPCLSCGENSYVVGSFALGGVRTLSYTF